MASPAPGGREKKDRERRSSSRAGAHGDRDRNRDRDRDREQRSGHSRHAGEAGAARERRGDSHQAREARGDPKEAHREHKEREHRERGDGHRSDAHRSDANREQRGHREHKERRESSSVKRTQEHAQQQERQPAPKPKNPDDQEAWLDSLISDCTDKRQDNATAAAPREKMPKRPSSRADSRPRGDEASTASQRAEKPSRPPDSQEARRPPVAPAAPAPVQTVTSRPAPRAEIPLSELHSDEEIEADENTKPPGNVQPDKVARDQVKNGVGSTPKVSSTPKGRAPETLNHSAIEEDIQVNASVIAKEEPKDEIEEEEIDYDDDFEEASGDDEEYKPKFKGSSQPTPEPEKPGKLVSIRPDSRSKRSPSPGLDSARDQPSAMADIKKAMENERMKAQKNAAVAGPNPTGAAAGDSRKGFLAEYESSMPQIKLESGNRPSHKKALERLRDLKKMGVLDRRTTEKYDLYSQRPQTTHSLFLAGKSLRFYKMRTVSCQTGEDDVETGMMTDDIWMEDKEMQFPTLTSGQGSQTGGEQMLPFLRRTLPLFEAAFSESMHRQMPQASLAAVDAQAAEDAKRTRSHTSFGLPDSFVQRYLAASVNIADLSVVPEWYGADHALVLFNWQWMQRPAPASGQVLEAFTRPLQSLLGLFPILSTPSVGGLNLRPARCLYSFCRLSSTVVVEGRPHLIIAGSEMGSLLVWDLREKANAPKEHLNRSPQVTEPQPRDPVDDVAHFQGPLWLEPAFSTDSFAFSATQEGDKTEDGFDDDGLHGGAGTLAPTGGAATVHGVEVCCVRCSEGAGSDPLLFALDLMGTVSFWRVLELANMGGSQVKLAFQGSICLSSSVHSIVHFMDARGLCIHPQQQTQFVVTAASGVHQAHRHRRKATVTDGPGNLELALHRDEDFGGGTAQPCGAAFNPFFPGLLLVAYAEGDLALFDCTICVPVTHWSGAVAKAPNLYTSVAWSTSRPCVFFVKSGDTLDVWDLAERAYAPLETVNLVDHFGPPTDPGIPGLVCSDLFVDAKGQPVVSWYGKARSFTLPVALTTPLQVAPPRYAKDERLIETLLVEGCEKNFVFPTLERMNRTVEVKPLYAVERDIMRRIVAGLHPLQAWT